MEQDIALILELIARKDSDGIHWYKLNRLFFVTEYSFASGQTLDYLTRQLYNENLIKTKGPTGALNDYWIITNRGKKWLSERGYDGSLANQLLSRLRRYSNQE